MTEETPPCPICRGTTGKKHPTQERAADCPRCHSMESRLAALEARIAELEKHSHPPVTFKVDAEGRVWWRAEDNQPKM